MKKERQRQIDEQVKKMNQEIVQKQKEKGAEHIDFRKKEEEAKHKARQDENRAERERQRELREKRKTEGRKQLGLDMIEFEALQEYRNKVKEDIEKQPKPLVAKGGIIAPIPQNIRPKSSNPQLKSNQLGQVQNLNNDLHSIFQNKQVDKDLIIEEEEKIQKEQELKRQREEILKDQKRKRREKMLEEQLKAEQERKRKEENMKQLNEELAKQKIENLQRLQTQQKIKEEQEKIKQLEKEKREKERRAKFGKKKSIFENIQIENGKDQQQEQIEELHDWIDQQINRVSDQINEQKEDLKAENISPPRIKQIKISDKKEKEKKILLKQRPVSAGSIQTQNLRKNNLQNETSKGLQPTMIQNFHSDNIQSNDIPGNSNVDYNEIKKFEIRQNRYGIFGDNGYSQEIEIKQRQPAILEKKKQIQGDSSSPKINLSKQGVLTAFQKIQEYHQQKLEHVEHANLRDKSLSPVAPGQERRILNQIHQQYLLNFDLEQNNNVTDQHQKQIQSVPGVINIEKEIKKQNEESFKEKKNAVIVIQKWGRGFLARRKSRLIRLKLQKEIEEEYGYFEKRVKFSTDYNLEKFLKDKEQLRKQNKTQNLFYSQSESILEKIGESSSSNKRIPIVSKIADPQSFNRKSKKKNSNKNISVNNFFPTASVRGPTQTERDPHSIINILLQRSMPPKPAVVQSPIKQEKSQKQPSKQKSESRSLYKKQQSEQISIQEEILSENIPNDDKQSIITSNKSEEGSIVEDIIEGSKNSINDSIDNTKPFQQLRDHKPFDYQVKGTRSDSIQEDIFISVNKRSGQIESTSLLQNNKKQSSVSIIEESHLGIPTSSRGSNKKSEDSIHESIDENIISGSKSPSSSSNVQAKIPPQLNKLSINEQERLQTIEQIKKFEEQRTVDQQKRDQLVSELLGELNRYESASISTLVIERMEKIISKSLSQKDQILIAQRLHELEMEKRHKEEIAKIREEQIQLMTQLMMNKANFSEKDRKQIIESVKRITTVGQHKQESKQDKDEEKRNSLKIKNSQSIEENIKLEGIQESLKEYSDIVEDIPDNSSSQKDEIIEEIKESLHHPSQPDEEQSSIKEDSQLAQMRRVMGSEQDIREHSKKTLDEVSGKKKNKKDNAGIFNKNSFDEFQERKFKEFLTDGSDHFFSQIDNQLESFKNNALKELDQELKRNIITPKTYHKKGIEIERWVEKKRNDLEKQIEPLHLHFKTIVDNLKKDKEIILDKIGLSPRPDHISKRKESSSIEYDEIEMEESNESETTRYAREQINRLAKRDNFFEQDPLEASESMKNEQKIKKKKAIAKKLLEEKERVIQQGLKEKLRQIEADQAKKMMNVALNIDPQKEIEKRIIQMKKTVEESSEILESARSISISQSGVPSESVNKKKVQFASPDKFRSSVVESASSVSNKHSHQKFEDSIDESINIQESFGPSIRDNHLQSSNQQSSTKLPTQKQNLSLSAASEKKTSNLQPPSIQESINEQQQTDRSVEYTEDFEQSHGVVSQKNMTPQQQKKQLSSYEKSASNTNIVEDDYSQNFEESIAQSQALQNLKESKIEQSIKSVVIESHNEVEEEEEEEEPIVSSAYVENIDETNEEEEVDEGKQNAQIQENGQVDPLQQSSDDQEVIQSSQSIIWQIDFTQKSQQKQQTNQAEELEQSSNEYSQQFTSEIPSEESKKEEILESFKSAQSQSQMEDEENIEALAEAFADEYLEIIMNDIQENQDLAIGAQHDEEEFKDKFPFNLEKEQEPEIQTPMTKPPEIKVKVEEKKSMDDLAREKYDSDLKKLQENYNANLRYLELIIDNINKDELIASMERPIEIDPLRKLAYIFSQDNEDANLHNDSINSSILLSLDYFIELEDQFKRQNGESELDKFIQSSHKAIFDAFNQALDMERPYKDNGSPAPWSKQIRLVKKQITEKQIDQIILKAKERVINWFKTGAGTRLAPLPPMPTNNQDDHSMPPPIIPSEEERINGLREVRLGMLMVRELEENEHKWIDYEDEDTQVKFDLADMVLDVLASEVTQFLYNKEVQN